MCIPILLEMKYCICSTEDQGYIYSAKTGMETSLCLPCISSTVSSPSSEDEKDKLHMAGLGEKVIGFSALNVDAESFRETIHSQSRTFQVATSCARQNLIQHSWNHCQT